MRSMQHDELLRSFREMKFDPHIAPSNLRRRLDRFAAIYPLAPEVKTEVIELGGRPAEVVNAGSKVCILYFHGGGFVTGSPRSHRHVGARIAQLTQGTVYMLDYRLAPESAFPAALEDCQAAYAALSGKPVVLAGDSAGGNLMFGTAVWAVRQKLPPPIGLVGISPWVNLATSSESYELLGPVDPLLCRPSVDWYADHYLQGAEKVAPLVSPLYADLTDLPPTLIQIGDHEVFFGDAIRMHQRLIAAGVDTTLSVAKGMFHVWHLYWPDLPEGSIALDEIAAFVTACSQRAG